MVMQRIKFLKKAESLFIILLYKKRNNQHSLCISREGISYMKKSSRWKTMILTGAFVLALNCGNVFASEAGMTGESNTEATIVEGEWCC